MSNNIVYRPLKSNEIRVLKVRSAIAQTKKGKLFSGEFILSFDLVHVPLHDCPPFTALSYRWTPNDDTDTIFVSETPVVVSRTLHLALTQASVDWEQDFRWSDAMKSVFTKSYKFPVSENAIWADALCIDQQSNSEKAVQVGLMKSIYEQSTQVHAWLGMAKDVKRLLSSTEAVKAWKAILMVEAVLNLEKEDFIEKGGTPDDHSVRLNYVDTILSREQVQMDEKSLAYRLSQIGPIERDEYKESVRQSRSYQTDMLPKQLREVWDLDWWSRCWMLQEATVNEKKVEFVLGSTETFNWSQLRACIATVDAFARFGLLRQDKQDATTRLGRPMSAIYSALDRFASLQAWRAQGILPPFLDILQLYRPSVAADARDKVFAALNVVSSPEAASVTIDYNKSVSDVYIDLCVSQLTKEVGSLDFLGYVIRPRPTDHGELSWYSGGNMDTLSDCQSRISNEHIPSWVPDWTITNAIHPLSKVWSPEPYEDPLGSTPYNACGRFRQVDAHVMNRIRLRLTGVKVDTVVNYFHMASSNSFSRYFSSLPHVMKAKFDSIWNGRGGRTAQQLDELISTVAVADVELSVDKRCGALRRSFRLETFRAESIEQRQQIERMILSCDRAVHNRTFGVTASGRLGLVPFSAHPVINIDIEDWLKYNKGKRPKRNEALMDISDGRLGAHDRPAKESEVWMFFGSSVLHLLRPINRSQNIFEYFGEVYLDGMMDGEVTDMMDAGLTRAETITLQ